MKDAKEWHCQYCGLSIISRRKLYEHYDVCIEKAKLPKDSIGRVKIDSQYDGFRKYASKLKNTHPLGHKHSIETRKHLSEVRRRWLEENPNHGLKWYIVNGIKVQGTWEKKFAEYLTESKINWQRGSKLKYKETHSYTPDFYCPEQNVYFEVKGFRRDRDIFKMHLVLNENILV